MNQVPKSITSRNGCMPVIATFAAIAVIAPVGCAYLAGPINRAAEKTADAIDAYCENFTADQRVEFRTLVNEEVATGRSIQVDCSRSDQLRP